MYPSEFGSIRPSVDPCIPFFKIRTDSTVRGFLHPLFYISVQIGGPRIPALPILKFGPNQQSKDHCIPLYKIRIDWTVRGSLHSLLKIRTASTVRGSLHPFF